ncbi:MAG: class I SAM-dependent methyltransferase [Actinobacteria bacterium]|nr:MAG: class I SAM-dependent methyltransferase [Actinomycetota bacterium]
MGEAERADLERLEAYVSSLPPGRILDVACGTGYLTRLLRGEVVGLDQSREMLDVARRRLPSVELVCAVVPPLPFEDDAFELLFTSHFYRHVVSPEERRRFLSEAFRVAREVVVVEQTRRPGFPTRSGRSASFAMARGTVSSSVTSRRIVYRRSSTAS